MSQDNAEASAWYRKAADQGDAVAQVNLGVMYGLGRGVAKDFAQAADWFRRAAEQGNAIAQLNLARAYQSGQGVAPDSEQAVAWYRKAADQGLARAQFSLGDAYEGGQGVTQDAALAVFWYRKAAEQGLAIAQVNLGLMYDMGQGVAQDYAQAAAWYRKAADQGDAKSMFNLGAMYAEGQGVPKDVVEANKWRPLTAVGHPHENRKQFTDASNATSPRMAVEIPQRSTTGSIQASASVPTGTAIIAPMLIISTDRRSACRHAVGSMGAAPMPSMTSRSGTASAGPTTALASGTKISADPKPEKPRARPLTNAATTRKTTTCQDSPPINR